MNKTWYEEVEEKYRNNIKDNETLIIALEILEDRKELLEESLKLIEEKEQLKEQRQELRSWLEEEINQRCLKYERWALDDCLNKLNELEGKHDKDANGYRSKNNRARNFTGEKDCL